jgi:hypothetical protein
MQPDILIGVGELLKPPFFLKIVIPYTKTSTDSFPDIHPPRPPQHISPSLSMFNPKLNTPLINTLHIYKNQTLHLDPKHIS